MQGNGHEPGRSEPSIDELRRMMEAKGLERDRERKRLSGLATKVLVIAALVVVIGILCTPGPEMSQEPAGNLDPDLAATAARIQEQLSNPPDGNGSSPGQAAGERASRKGDLQFAMDLIRYVQPEAPRTKLPPNAPKRQAADR